jgi:hypothetical protein
MAEKVKDPYAGRRSPGARAGRVDEDALVRRYAGSKWSIAQCARSFGVSRHRARSILLARGTALRSREQELDPGAVARLYLRFGDYTALAQLLGTSPDRITQILDEAGIRHDSSRWVAPHV